MLTYILNNFIHKKERMFGLTLRYVIMEVDKVRASKRFTEITEQTGLYNIQAIDNIPSIMQRGLLSNEKTRSINHVSIAMNEVQARRELVRIPNGLRLHQYANLYFDPRNPMLSRKRSQKSIRCQALNDIRCQAL
mgnify:CR=1 FL=1